MPKPVESVLYDDGTQTDCLALVRSSNEDGTLNLVYFPDSSPVEKANTVPEGTGGHTWHEA